MTQTSPSPRGDIGDNKPPLDRPEDLTKRLERDHVPLLDKAIELDAEANALPEAPATDEECGKLSDYVVKVKAFQRSVDQTRVSEKEGYLEGSRVVDSFFKEVAKPLDPRLTAVENRIRAYSRAKAEKEAAERRAREDEARRAAEEQRRAEAEARRAAEAAQEEERLAAERVRNAADAEQRAEAERQMREAGQRAELEREAAKQAGKDSAAAERHADALERSSDVSKMGKLSRVSTGGSTSSVTKTWAHRIDDGEKLIESLGPLGRYISDSAISSAITAAREDFKRAGTIAANTKAIPGVTFFEDVRTNIRAARQ